MKILALSDLNWNREAKSVSVSNMMKMDMSQLLECNEFSSLRFYFSIIEKHKPDVILLCGDITGDGSCGHGYVSILLALFRLLEDKKIKTRFISGNHDEQKYYDEVLKYCDKLTYIRELTDIYESINGVKFFGLNYEQTRTKTKVRSFLCYTADFLITHCCHTQRLNLFDYNVKFIITGHYDMKVISPKKQTFISLDNDFPYVNYAVIDYTKTKSKIKFYTDTTILEFIRSRKSFKLVKVIPEPSESTQFIYNKPFQKAIERLIYSKRRSIPLSEQELLKIRGVKVNRDMKISDKFINAYL